MTTETPQFVVQVVGVLERAGFATPALTVNPCSYESARQLSEALAHCLGLSPAEFQRSRVRLWLIFAPPLIFPIVAPDDPAFCPTVPGASGDIVDGSRWYCTGNCVGE